MKILLHIGQGKTGTTALQRSLHAARDRLRPKGILYPSFSLGSVAHHMLIALCESDDRIPPHVIEPFRNLDALRASAAAALYNLRLEVERKQPKVMILSSETFIFGLGRAGKEKLARLLQPFSAEVLPVVYVREPGALYRSRLQERMRIAATTLPPGPQRIRDAIEDTEAVWGQIAVCQFDTGMLAGGDILKDFATRFLSDLIDPNEMVAGTENTSLSAEAILALSRFRRLVAPDRDWQRDPRSDRLFRWLQLFEETDPAVQRIRLRPGVAEAVRRASVDYLWLLDRFGMVFPEINYADVDGTPPLPEMKHLPLEDLIEVDFARYDQLLLSVLADEFARR